MKNNLIVDCNNLLHRVFWICNKYQSMSTPKMFFTCIKNYMEDFLVQPSDLYLAWDNKLLPDTPSFRRVMEGVEYKATRDHEKNQKVYEMCDYVRNISKNMGLCNVYPGSLEADDVMAYLSTTISGHSIIVSVDQDLLQMIDASTDVFNPIKKITITQDNFTDYYPVALSDFIHYKAIMGDKSDNIPGLPKVGPKRAAAMVKSGLNLKGDYQAIYERNMAIMDLRAALREHTSEAQLYKKQVEYHTKNRQVDIQKIRDICDEINCYDLPEDFINFYTSASPGSALLAALS